MGLLANCDLKPLSPRNQPGQQAALPAARDAIAASRFYPFESYHLNDGFISLILFFFFSFLIIKSGQNAPRPLYKLAFLHPVDHQDNIKPLILVYMILGFSALWKANSPI